MVSFQKHMRRHINPIMVEVGPNTSTAEVDHTTENNMDPTDTPKSLAPSNLDLHSGPSTSMPQLSEGSKNTRPTSPALDLNVQYFPCKTCGSKFPSYYFVHKHRRLCHGEEISSNGSSDCKPDNLRATLGGAGDKSPCALNLST